MYHKKIALLSQPSPQGFALICLAFSGKLRNSEIPEYWNLPLKRGQKPVRHSEIPNYRKNAHAENPF
jgi:hypothetical protein